MKMISRYHLHLLVLAVWVCTGWLPGATLQAQQANSSAAKAELGDYLDAMSNPGTNSGKNANYYLHCRVEMVPRDSLNQAVHTEEFKYWIGQGKVRYQSDRMQVLGDEKHTATIIPHTRSIYLSPSPSEENLALKQGHKLALRDSMWRYVNVLEVEEKCLPDGRNGKVFTVAISPMAQFTAGISKAIFTVDVERERFLSVKIWHPFGHELATSNYEYLDLNYNHSEPALEAPVRKLLFAERGQLNPQWADFQLVELDKQ